MVERRNGPSDLNSQELWEAKMRKGWQDNRFGVEENEKEKKMIGCEILYAQYSGSTGSEPTAAVRIKKPDGSEVIEAAVSGNGPVDAVSKAIQRALSIVFELVDFSISIVGHGSEAAGEVTVKLQENDDTYEGSASGTDIIIASAEALMDALNKKIAFDASVTTHTV